MSAAEAAEYAQKSQRALYDARKAGHLVGHLPRGRQRGYLYLREDLDEWLAGAHVRPAAAS